MILGFAASIIEPQGCLSPAAAAVPPNKVFQLVRLQLPRVPGITFFTNSRHDVFFKST